MLPHCGCPSLSLAWLTHGLLLAGHRAGRGSKGVCPARSSSALLAGDYRARRGGIVGVIIGMDPHKRPATIEVINEQAAVLAAGRYGTGKAGYADMLAAARTFADRVWAVEGCNGIGRHL